MDPPFFSLCHKSSIHMVSTTEQHIQYDKKQPLYRLSLFFIIYDTNKHTTEQHKLLHFFLLFFILTTILDNYAVYSIQLFIVLFQTLHLLSRSI